MAATLITKSVFLVSLLFPGDGSVVYKYEPQTFDSVAACIEAARNEMDKFQYWDKNDAGCTLQEPKQTGYQITVPIAFHRAAKGFWVTED